MPRHHLIISGTGRAGTTLLVQLFTKLGLDTGFSDIASGMYANCNAGMEKDLRIPDTPYIVKSPFLCEQLEEVLQTNDVVIDHAIIPVRDLFSAAESRRAVQGNTAAKKSVTGGLVRTRKPADQESVLAQWQHRLVCVLVKHEIPITWLYFPRFAKDPEYLYKQISPIIAAPKLLPNLDYARFLEAFRAVSRPDLIHDFKKESTHANSGKSLLHKLQGFFNGGSKTSGNDAQQTSGKTLQPRAEVR